MPSIADLRKDHPRFADLSDEEVVHAVSQDYPDLSTQDVATALGVKLPEQPMASRGLGTYLKDAGVSLMSGAAGVPEAAVGLADMASGGAAGKALSDAGLDFKGAHQYWEDKLSPQQKAADQAVQDAHGVVDITAAALTHPSTIAKSVIESIPGIVAGGVVGRAAMGIGPLARAAGASAPVLAGAIGEGTIMAGQDAEQIRQETKDGYLTPMQTGDAAAIGVLGGGLSLLGGKVAQKLGIHDIDTMVAAGKLNDTAGKGIVRRVLEGALSEGLLEELPQSVMEQVLQNHALGKPLDEGVDNAAVMGALSGGAMGAGANVRGGHGHAAPKNDESAPGAHSTPLLAAPDSVIHVDPQGTATPGFRRPSAPADVQDVPFRDAGPLSRAASDATAAAAPGANVDPAKVAEAVNLAVKDEAANRPTPQDQLQQKVDAEKRATEAPPVDDLFPLPADDAAHDRDAAIYADVMAQKDGEQPATAPAAAAPAPTVTPGTVDEGAHESHSSPLNDKSGTDNQILANNAPLGHVKVGGLDISVENADGSTRTDKHNTPPQWSTPMQGVHYGYFRGTVAADSTAGKKQGVDVFLRAGTPTDYSGPVYVVDQIHQDGSNGFDEHKVMLGFNNRAAAVQAYKRHYSAGWKLGRITEMPFDQFKGWLKDGDTTKAASPKGPMEATSAAATQQEGAAAPAVAGAVDAAPTGAATTAAAAAVEAAGPAQVAAPAAAPIEAPAAAAPHDENAHGSRWTRMTEDQRRALVGQTVAKPKAVEKIPRQKWEDLSPGWQSTLAKIMDKAPAAPQESADASKNPPPAADTGSKPNGANDGTHVQEPAAARPANAGKPVATGNAAEAAPSTPQGRADDTAAAPAAGAGPVAEPARDKAGNVIQHPKLEGRDRWQYPPKQASADPAQHDAQRRVVDYMNGDIDRPTLMQHLEDSGLPEGTIRGITQRIQGDGPSNGEIDAMMKRREAAAPKQSAQQRWDNGDEAVRTAMLREVNRADLVGHGASGYLGTTWADMSDNMRAKMLAHAGEPLPKPSRKPVTPQVPVAAPAPAPAADAAPKKQASAETMRAEADLNNALADLADLLGKPFRANIVPEQDAKLVPILTRVLDAAFRLGYHKFKDAAKFTLDTIRSKLGGDVADALTLEHLQGAYIAMSGGKAGADKIGEVGKIGDKAEIEAHSARVYTEEQPTAKNAEPDAPKETLLGASDDPRRNDAVDDQPLENALPEGGEGDGAEGHAQAGEGVREPDAQGNGNAQEGGPGRGDRVDGGEKPVLPRTPAEIRPLADGPVGKTEDRPQQLAGENPGNFAITPDFALGAGTDGEKIEANLNALRTLRKVQAEGRYPTREEQATMARYVGWGGLKNVFDTNRKDETGQYGRAQRELRTLLNDAEFRAAAGSIRNAHYTSRGVVDAMWRAVRHMGFQGGRVLEPTVGIGNFLGLQPADMAASSQWHASELDAVTGQMAAMIYPEANILAATGFQAAPFADGAFDLSIGNPPFGAQAIEDKSAKRKHLSGMKIHNYIIAKAGMHLRPGGVMSMVVTHRFLDTANPEARAVLAKDFRFLGAFRLPNDAFAKNAGTEVVTDVVFLQKLRPDEARERDAAWLDTNGSITVDGQQIRVNRYYQENPTHILGRSAMDGTMYARSGDDGEYTVHGDGRDLGNAIDDVIAGPGFANMAGALVKSNGERALAPAMLTQSDLPVGGVMVDGDGKVLRRELDDIHGNAVVQEITPETLWKDQAADWQALRQAIDDVKKAGTNVTAEDAQEVLTLAGFLYKADGTPKSSPSKATEAVYGLADALAKQGAFRWNHDDVLAAVDKTLAAKKLGEDGYRRLRGMLDLRNRTLALVRAEQTDSPKMEALRAELNDAYDAFVKANGHLSDSDNANLLEGDVGAEAGLEANFTPAISAAVAKSSGQPQRKASATKSDILAHRVNFPYKEIDRADSTGDSLFASLTEHGKVDLPYMARITGKSVRAVLDELTSGDHPQLFRNPETDDYEEAERYLSGNVKHKLAMAREQGMHANVKALEAVQPAPKTQKQVKPNIRGMWMPADIFEEFLGALGYRDATITAIQSQGILSAQATSLTLTDFGVQFRHERKSPVDMFNAAAAGKSLTVYDQTRDGPVKNDAATKEVNAMAERMGKVFMEWAYSSEDRAKRIVDAFNEKMNTHIPRTYDGVKYLRPVGASPSIKLRRTQKNAAWRMMQEPTILMDHVVGAGKTFTLITGIMERRRMGLSRKPMIAVPNHLVTQWARDFYKLYPGAKVLAASPADFAKKNRRRLLARIATGDYDAVIVGHTSIGFMQTPADDLTSIVNEKLEGLREALAAARASKESKRTLGQIEDRIERYEGKLKELADRTTDDIGIDFKALGVDYLAVDEAHEFKNLEYSTSGERVVGMNDPNGSKKAFDLYGKVRGLLDRKGGVAFATGTPVSNSLVEVYTMMSYLAHDELKTRGQEHFDAWSGAYAATETRLEYTATQKLKPRRVLAGLNNLSALRQLYEHFADIITMRDIKRMTTEDLQAANAQRAEIRKLPKDQQQKALDAAGLKGIEDTRTEFPVPKVEGGGRKLVAGDITPAQREYMDYLVARMGAIEANKGDKEYARIDNALNVLTDARKMSLDIRIVDPHSPRDENGKVATAAKRIKETYDKWDADRGTQLVFCDLSTPAKTAAKTARSIISATIEKLYEGKQAQASAKRRLEGLSHEKQWQALTERADELADDQTVSEERRDDIAQYMDGIEDPEATMSVADIGFSVYDDLRTLLTEKGIPESEIAFIHDYNTPDQKEKLFDRVNNGYVRVLLGSSAKMGAGTNAQRRLVALHHMDAPWRPSDVEQREGRIIRQGNMLYERDPDGFHVGINAYSTNNTSDTVMWQILERKAGAIEQFRDGGLDDVQEEGGDSDQYAEFMATSTGNPVFRQKLEAERRLTELEASIGGALITRSNAKSFLESYASTRDRYQRDSEAWHGFSADKAAYGGESGTEAEFTKALEAAQSDYAAQYAEFTEKKAAFEAALAKWEAAPESTRGKKPAMPVQPAQPSLMTASVQAASGYARTMALALKEAKVGRSVRITMGDGALILDGETIPSGKQWTLRAEREGRKLYLTSSTADTPEASSRLTTALMPQSVQASLRDEAENADRAAQRLEERKKEADRAADIEVDTSARDAAREELRWYKAQVAFAEVEADVARGERPNRFIARDKRRPLSQTGKVTLEAPQKIEIGSHTYETTGVKAGAAAGVAGFAQILQAKRDDGLPAVVVERTGGKDGEKTYEAIDQPESVRQGASTNLAQTGDPRANTSDVLFRQDASATSILPAGAKRIAELKATMDDITEAWARKPDVVVLESVASAAAPPEVRREARRLIANGGSVPSGVYFEGRVYLFADRIGSDKQAAEVLFHEVLGHMGLRGAFRGQLDGILRQIAAARPADIAKIIARNGFAETDRLRAAEEFLAEMAQTTPELGFVRRAVAAIRTFLRQFFPKMELTDDEIVRNFILPARAYITEGGPGPKGGAPVPVFSQAPAAHETTPMFSQGATGVNSPRDFWNAARGIVDELAHNPGQQMNWWQKTFGTPYDLAQRHPRTFGVVYNRVQQYLRDVSAYATEAADLAPRILPKLDNWKDAFKSPLKAEDAKAIQAPVFEGTLVWARDTNGKPVKASELEARYENLDVHRKAAMLLGGSYITPADLQALRRLPIDSYESAVNSRFDQSFTQPGIVWKDEELRSQFKLTDDQIGLYREARAAIDKSLTNLVLADMVRYAGKDAEPIADAIMETGSLEAGSDMLREYLLSLEETGSARSRTLTDMAAKVVSKALRGQQLIDRGYAPLSRFGTHVVDVMDKGERVYFGLFESRWEARAMAAKMRAQFPEGTITRGTTSQDAYKLFAGITPETAELFGEMLGLEADGDGKANAAFQSFLKEARSSRSAMKRLIERKGIAGFSDDVGRVLAGFVYSNARQTASGIHAKGITAAANNIPQGQGELKDMAVRLTKYVTEPQDEAVALRGVLFAQYLGGNIASMLVNMTQPFVVTAPYLTQFDKVGKVAGFMKGAVADAWKGDADWNKVDPRLGEALRLAAERGDVAPQEVHQLMRQAAGRASLSTHDGTATGRAKAMANNLLSRATHLWGQPFAVAELFNRRVTFIAAYRLAVARGIADPAGFAVKAINDTQFVYNKGNKPQWARGAVGALLFTFKQYSVSYLELVHRMYTQGGPQGKKSALMMLAMLMLAGGAGGLPFEDDIIDLIDGIGQRLGYNLRTKHARQQFLEDHLGKAMGGFVDKGVTGLPGMPFDLAGRFGMGNLIPGTGLLTEKKDHTSDVMELAGPAGEFAKRGFQAADQIAHGNLVDGALTVAPTSIRNLQKAYDMETLGYYPDSKGRKVVETDGGDVLAKAIGFQPSAVSDVQGASQDVQQLKEVAQMKESEIADSLAMALLKKDPTATQSARDAITQWNRDNPESPISIKQSQVMRRVREMNKTKAQRLEASSPTAIRRTVHQELTRGD